MEIEKIEQEIIAEFEKFDNWMDRYNYLIVLGKSYPLIIEDEYKTDKYVIPGCQSKVWLHASLKDDKVFFEADVDAIITKGIISLLIRVLSGQTPDDIISAKLEFIEKIGLKEHLSPTRSNGLVSMVDKMKLYALTFISK